VNVELALLADYAAVTREGKLVAAGIFDLLAPPAFPWQHPTMFVALRVHFHPGEDGSHQIKLRLVNPDGTEAREMMSKDLAYYRLLPYEREWAVGEEAGEKYFVVRLKDLPAVAGDGSTRDEAANDLREAFDEFVSAWIEGGRQIPEPARPFTVPSLPAHSPTGEGVVSFSEPEAGVCAGPKWIDNAVVYRNALVEPASAEPRMESRIEAVG